MPRACPAHWFIEKLHTVQIGLLPSFDCKSGAAQSLVFSSVEMDTGKSNAKRKFAVKFLRYGFGAGAALVLVACFGFQKQEVSEAPSAPVPARTIISTSVGQASWYGPGFHGRLTANGETFDSQALTAAHLTLPFGTTVRVINQINGRDVVVRINDRGPYVGDRIIDLSQQAAQVIGIIDSGVGSVKLEVYADEPQPAN